MGLGQQRADEHFDSVISIIVEAGLFAWGLDREALQFLVKLPSIAVRRLSADALHLAGSMEVARSAVLWEQQWSYTTSWTCHSPRLSVNLVGIREALVVAREPQIVELEQGHVQLVL